MADRCPRSTDFLQICIFFEINCRVDFSQQVLRWDHILQTYKFKLSSILCVVYQHFYPPHTIISHSLPKFEKKGRLPVTSFNSLHEGPSLFVVSRFCLLFASYCPRFRHPPQTSPADGRPPAAGIAVAAPKPPPCVMPWSPQPWPGHKKADFFAGSMNPSPYTSLVSEIINIHPGSIW